MTYCYATIVCAWCVLNSSAYSASKKCILAQCCCDDCFVINDIVVVFVCAACLGMVVSVTQLFSEKICHVVSIYCYMCIDFACICDSIVRMEKLCLCLVCTSVRLLLGWGQLFGKLGDCYGVNLK